MKSQASLGGAVPERCANPACGIPFSLHEGKLFQFEIRSIAISCVEPVPKAASEATFREMARFWLCGRCSADLTLTLTPESGIVFQSVKTEEGAARTDA